MTTDMTTETMTPDALYRLVTWLSPAYPVGAFSYSSGIEWAVEAGDITDAETLRHWLEAMLADGPGVNDGIFFSASASRDRERRRRGPARGRRTRCRVYADARAPS